MATNNIVKIGAVLRSIASVLITYFLYMFYINITLRIHLLWILSPLQHDIYYQQYYEDLKHECVTVVLNNAVLILILEYAFVFAGIQAAPQGGPIVVGITLRVFLCIKSRVLLLLW